MASLFRPSSACKPYLAASHLCKRQLHHKIPPRPIPPPTPFVPDVSTFLTVIGRQLLQHAAKIPSWEALFTLTTTQLRELGVEPARSRRYLLRWREKFRNGEFGVGGDLQHVENGVGEVRVVEVPVPKELQAGSSARATATRSQGMKKMIVNVTPGEVEPVQSLKRAKPVKGITVKGAHTICGPYVEEVKGTNGYVARIAAKEGIWEDRRGHKVDGGERRKAEVRAKRRAQENK